MDSGCEVIETVVILSKETPLTQRPRNLIYQCPDPMYHEKVTENLHAIVKKNPGCGSIENASSLSLSQPPTVVCVGSEYARHTRSVRLGSETA